MAQIIELAVGVHVRLVPYLPMSSRSMNSSTRWRTPDTPYALLATRDIKCRSRGMRWQSVE